MPFPDISEYYTPDLAIQEEASWLMEGPQPKHCLFLRPRLAEHKISSIVEYGCGTGILAAMLPTEIDYFGVDKNAWFVGRATKRNAVNVDHRRFVEGDVRTVPVSAHDLGMCWSFLKHFGLHEWDEILSCVLARASYGAFDVQIVAEEFDNGDKYHHSFVTEERLAKALAAVGHKEEGRELLEAFVLPSGQPVNTFALWTRRVRSVSDAQAVINKPMGSWDQSLKINGEEISDLSECSLRWVRQGAGNVPVLYRKGHRVAQPWEADIKVKMPADPHGGNANTT